MADNEKAHGRLWGKVLFGVALGLVVGLVFAPKSGKRMRAQIRAKGRMALNDAKEIYTDACAKAKQIIEEARHQATEIKKDADQHLSETRLKAKEILGREEKSQGGSSAAKH